MRTLVLIVIGLAIVGVALTMATSAHAGPVALAFSAAWLLATGWNLRAGLVRGYTLGEELPIHALLYAVPVAAAWAGAWWLGAS